jgi:FAD-dependent oxidoreductase domain-containing protein 1
MNAHAAGQADVVIIGGGVIGSSVALHLRERQPALRVVVVERDPDYVRASSRLATGGIRQQYCSTLNVRMAQHSIGFYRALDERLAAAGSPVRAWFRQRGYLFLADAAGADALERRAGRQRECGARAECWSPAQVRAYVPGLACDDVVLAVFGADDGYLDPRAVLAGMRLLATAAGAVYVTDEVHGIERRGGRVAGVTTTAGRIATPVVVNAAGAFARAVARAADVELPIHPVRQHLFRVELEAPLPTRIPMIFDPDGTHWRLDDVADGSRRDRIVIGRSRAAEPPGENFECDRSRLDGEMLPAFARRHPHAAVGEVVEAWAGLYEMTPDHNGLVGEHPGCPGFVVAAGFSGHGLMLAPATGRAVAELITDGACRSFDIAPLAPDRFDRGVYFEDGALV